MKIGLDFDGVIADTLHLKEEVAKEKYNADIPPERFKEDLVAEDNTLTREQYRDIMNAVCATMEVGMRMKPYENAVATIFKLQADGHALSIITSRSAEEIVVAETWSKEQGLSLPFISVGYGKTKAQAVEGYDVYLDDDLPKLIPLQGIVPHLFLFSGAHNRNDDIKEIATRVESWTDFYSKITALSKLPG